VLKTASEELDMIKLPFLRHAGRPGIRGLRLARRFSRSRSGVAAVEFVLLAPILITVWVGMVFVTDGFYADKKVTLLSRTLADITSQMTVVSAADMDTIFMAAESVMYPKPATALGMRITAIDIDANGVPFVDWSVTPSNAALQGNFTPLGHCRRFNSIPEGLRTPRTSIVLAEVTMDYQASYVASIVHELFHKSLSRSTGNLPLADSLYMRPRQSAKVAFSPATSTCPGYKA
jgi:Flp pilus assembly protein TadG